MTIGEPAALSADDAAPSPAAAATRVARRGTRAEQRLATRRRLLDATIESLYERGYAHTTTLEVQARAGVSRGTLLHQFSSRTELVVAAIDHLSGVRFESFREEALAVPPGANGFDTAVEVLARLVTRPESLVAVELWNASRTDPDLIDAMLRHQTFAQTQIGALFDLLVGPAVASDPRYPPIRDVVMQALAGVALGQHLRPAGWLDSAVAEWKALGRDLGSSEHRSSLIKE